MGRFRIFAFSINLRRHTSTRLIKRPFQSGVNEKISGEKCGLRSANRRPKSVPSARRPSACSAGKMRLPLCLQANPRVFTFLRNPSPLRVHSRKFASKSGGRPKIFLRRCKNLNFRKITKPAWTLDETAENSRFQLLSKKVCQAYHEIFFCPSLLKQWRQYEY